ncbi:sulfurtransferase complex subunit TusB [Litorilituus sediminis]|uniref:Sulfurtransferase complex subunit TusB n=1 Tax=Litorilituus sediminis TaxID=718192 RepID=A0A4P6P5E3_9GAMM|nr:sulfurtransferase complex subunit TusB [Litorilituus sediminis]QBG34592.1 sulfurtransferase complex subunit TusB [Litorilituus sediminis]
MAILHIVRNSGFQSNELQQCLDIICESDVLVFIDDGSYNVNHPALMNTQSQLPGLEVKVMAHHASARAIAIPNSIEAISNNDLVQLTFQLDRTMTWQ